MKRLMIVSLVLFVLGCVSEPIEPIKTLMTDPHFARHQEELDVLESSYLKGQLTYHEYLEKKKELEDKYTQEVREREKIIHHDRE